MKRNKMGRGRVGKCIKENVRSVFYSVWAAAAVIPETLPPLRYLMEPIDTPRWHNFFRAVLVFGFVSLMFAAAYYSRQKNKVPARRRRRAANLSAWR